MKTNLLKRLYSSSKGFTLIELLVVIAIVGVLAATLLVIINPGQRIASARNSRVRADVSNIGSAAGVFYSDTGTVTGCTAQGYPTAFGVTAAGCTTPVTFMAALSDPTGTTYDIETNPGATAISIAGTAYADGVTAAGVWCWRSATGVVVYQLNDA